MSIRTETSPGITVRTYVPQASFAVPLSIRLLCAWTHDECAFVQGSNGLFKAFESCEYACGPCDERQFRDGSQERLSDSVCQCRCGVGGNTSRDYRVLFEATLWAADWSAY